MSEHIRYPWETPVEPAAMPEPADGSVAKPKPRGRRPTAIGRRTAPDWLYHYLTVSGPADRVEQFAAAACGAGVIPWRLDGAAVEDTVFHLAVTQPAHLRTLTVEGCRILARQFRDRVEAHQARAAAQVGRSLVCPFDLHALLPVPDPVLQLGSAHPTALAWLKAHWGVTDRLRHVTVRAQATAGRRLPPGHMVIGYGFFTHGETPRAAVARLGQDWPTLRFSITPRPSG
jgi:hypothetical protein